MEWGTVTKNERQKVLHCQLNLSWGSLLGGSVLRLQAGSSSWLTPCPEVNHLWEVIPKSGPKGAVRAPQSWAQKAKCTRSATSASDREKLSRGGEVKGVGWGSPVQVLAILAGQYYIVNTCARTLMKAYLIFVIFLHEQNFWRIKFTPKKRINYDKIHSKLPFLRYYGKIHIRFANILR